MYEVIPGRNNSSYY